MNEFLNLGNALYEPGRMILAAIQLDTIQDARLFALELVLGDGEGGLEEVLLLLLMGSLEARSDGGGGVTTGVHDVLAVVVIGLVEESLDAGLDEAPGTGVEGLLLAPDDSLGVGVVVEVVLELLPREGVELLDAGEGDVVDLVVGAVLLEGGVDLAGAEDDAVDLLGGLYAAGGVLGVRDNTLEGGAGIGEVFDVRAGERVAEEGLREEDDQG